MIWQNELMGVVFPLPCILLTALALTLETTRHSTERPALRKMTRRGHTNTDYSASLGMQLFLLLLWKRSLQSDLLTFYDTHVYETGGADQIIQLHKLSVCHGAAKLPPYVSKVEVQDGSHMPQGTWAPPHIIGVCMKINDIKDNICPKRQHLW